ncbi:MAG: WD40/YVTN/BNR-like repeat-containing protein [Anaerolineae bacterium]
MPDVLYIHPYEHGVDSGYKDMDFFFPWETIMTDNIQDLVYSLAASPNFVRDGICFAARHSGLYRSEDGGLTWQNAYASLELDKPLITAAVAVSPNFEADRSVFAGVPGGILRSVDGGKSWYISGLPSPPPFISTLVVSPNFAQDGTLLAGTMEDGVFRSTDRGSHWSPCNFGLLDLNVLSMAISPEFATDETLFVGTVSGIFRSTNGGRAWREVNFPSDFAPVLSLAISPNYADDGILFAGTESFGLFFSDDRGNSWTRLGEEILTGAVNAIILSPNFPEKPDILALLGDALLISRDFGRRWSDWKAGLSIEQGMVSVAAPQGLEPGAPLLVGLADGGVLRL